MDTVRSFAFTPGPGCVLETYNGVNYCVGFRKTGGILYFGVLELFSAGQAQWMGRDADHAGVFLWQMATSESPIGNYSDVGNFTTEGGASDEVVWRASGTALAIINQEGRNLIDDFRGEANKILALRFQNAG